MKLSIFLLSRHHLNLWKMRYNGELSHRSKFVKGKENVIANHHCYFSDRRTLKIIESNFTCVATVLIVMIVLLNMKTIELGNTNT